MNRFRASFYKGIASWFNSGESELVNYTVGFMQDLIAERFRLSHEARLPSYCPSDALAQLGRDRLIIRGRNESAAAYSARLLRYLDDHRVRGNPYALMDQMFAYLQTAGVTLRTVDNSGNWYERAADGTRTATLNEANWQWDGEPDWARWWLIIFSDQGPWTTQWDPTVEGAYSGTTTATADDIAGVMSVIREWSPAGTRCEWVIVAFGNPATTFCPTAAVLPDGTWGTWSADSPRRPTRSADARYWRGPR
jgi:hypothetical protein